MRQFQLPRWRRPRCVGPQLLNESLLSGPQLHVPLCSHSQQLTAPRHPLGLGERTNSHSESSHSAFKRLQGTALTCSEICCTFLWTSDERARSQVRKQDETFHDCQMIFRCIPLSSLASCDPANLCTVQVSQQSLS